MRVINSGNIYEVFDDSLRTYDSFPAQTYIIRFSNMKGFYLEEHPNSYSIGEKVYGCHVAKIQKVLNSFFRSHRNLGVILSGEKGIGKSLFAKMLSAEAISKGMPVIIVDKYVPGIASYIESIQQECVVLFDEFDKTFGDVREKDGEVSPQASMLSLFDGISDGKKLFVITCNSIYKLDEFLINRPGRFHYHLRFDYPSESEIKEYLMDNLPEQYHKEIEPVVSFSRKANLNYDCLRAIAFEISSGLTFKESISDLNIVKVNRGLRYDIKVHYSNGFILKAEDEELDLFENKTKGAWVGSGGYNDEYVHIDFNPSEAKFDTSKMQYIIPAELVKFEYDDDKEYESRVKAIKEVKPLYVSITKSKSKDIHYAL